MTDASGAFWSATDADSEGEEGTFFVWTPAQLREALGDGDGERAAELFRATDEGNFEGSNVLSLARVPDRDELAFLQQIRPKLYAARARRPPPLTDTKILTAWNGLMISAFARAGLAFAREDYVERAARAAEALLAREKPGYDGAEPTGNSVAALTLLRLEALTGEAGWREQAEKLLRSFGSLLAGAPAALGEMLLAVDFLLAEPREVVLVRPA